MTPLNYLTIVTSLFTIAVGIHLLARPWTVGWPRRRSQIVGGSMALLATLTIVLTLMQSHGKA
jgi:hypothetical protein